MTPQNQPTLNDLRLQIDGVDQKIIQIIGDRMALVKQVGVIKQGQNLPPLDPHRWQEVLKTRSQWGIEVGLPKEFVTSIFNTIHDQALTIEKEQTL